MAVGWCCGSEWDHLLADPFRNGLMSISGQLAKKDAMISEFMQPEFSCREYAKRVMQADVATGLEETGAEQTVHNIALRLRSLDAAIRDLVTKHQEELLHQAGQTAELKQSVIGIDACADRLAKAAGRVKRDLILPFEELKRHVALLERLQSASDLLRRVTRVTANIRKLKAVLHRPSAGAEPVASYDFSALASFDSRELGKAAQMLYDIEQYTADEASAQLREVGVVKSELPWLVDAGKAVRSRATALLFKGMDTLNQAELGAALQMFFDLKCLPERVEEAVARAVDQVSSAASACFDTSSLAKTATPQQPAGPKKPGGPKGTAGQPPLGAEGAWKSVLWQRLDQLLERLFRSAVQIWNLQRVLCKKRDALSHTRLIDVVLNSGTLVLPVSVASSEDGESEWPPARASVLPAAAGNDDDINTSSNVLFERFWGAVTSKIRTQVALSVASSTFVRDCLVEQYPKLRTMLLNACMRLQRNTDSRAADVASVGGSAAEQSRLLWCVSGLTEVFQSRSIARINEPISIMFPKASGIGALKSKAMSLIGKSASTEDILAQEEEMYPDPPTHAVVSLLVKAVQNEFHGCQADLRLCRDIAKCVVGALKTFVNRVEGIVVTNPFATHIADHFQRTGAQRHNHALVARLAQVDRALDDFCAAQEPAVASVLSQSFTPAHDAIRAQIANVVDPYLVALADKLESMLQPMHQQSYIAVAASHDVGSPYMTTLTDAVALVNRLQLSGLPDGVIADTARLLVVRRLATVFCRWASLIRPMDDSGRLRLAQDINNFEFALEQMLPPSSLKDPALLELRALKDVLFLPTNSLSPDSDVIKVLKPSTVMHVLLARGPPEMELPHARSSMTVAEYSAWVDGMVAASGVAPAAVSGARLDRKQLLAANRACYLHAEQAVWVRVRGCLDKFAQRVAGTAASPFRGSDTSAVVPAAPANDEYLWLTNNGPKLLTLYRDSPSL